MSEEKQSAQNFESISKGIGSLLIPVALALFGYLTSAALQDQAARAKIVEDAINILQNDKQTTKFDVGLRAWAAAVIDTNFKPALPPDLLKEIPNTDMPTPHGPSGDTASTSTLPLPQPRLSYLNFIRASQELPFDLSDLAWSGTRKRRGKVTPCQVETVRIHLVNSFMKPEVKFAVDGQEFVLLTNYFKELRKPEIHNTHTGSDTQLSGTASISQFLSTDSGLHIKIVFDTWNPNNKEERAVYVFEAKRTLA